MFLFSGKERTVADVTPGQEAGNVIDELSEHGQDEVSESGRLHRVPERAWPEPAEEVQLHRVAEGRADEQLPRVDTRVWDERAQASSVAAQRMFRFEEVIYLFGLNC